MADVSKVKINNTTYDVKDETARTNLATKAPLASPALTGTPTAPTATSGTSTTQIATTAFAKGEADKKVSKSGDTMTSALIIEDDGITEKRTTADVLVAPDNTIYAIPVSTKDKNDKMYGYIQTTMYSDGMVSQQIAARNWTDENTSVTNGLALRVASDGTRSISLTNSSIWLDALGLSDSGWQSLTDNTKFTGTIYYRKIGKVIHMTTTSSGIELKSALSSGSNITLGTLPSGYRPAYSMVGAVHGATTVISVCVWANGNVVLNNASGSSISTSTDIFFSTSGMI